MMMRKRVWKLSTFPIHSVGNSNLQQVMYYMEFRCSFLLVQIDRAFEVTTEFFAHSVKEKENYYARMGNDFQGYICLEKERYYLQVLNWAQL